MSRFYMTMNAGMSNSSTVTRRAHAGHGASAVVASYKGAIEVTPYDKEGKDWVRIIRKPWQGSGGKTVVVYNGPFDCDPLEPGMYSTDLSS